MPENKTEITLAIFPFENLTQGNAQDVFCRAFYIDIITELSRFKQFRIVAYESIKNHSAFITSPDAAPPDFEYSIQGSFRFFNNTIRINAQLINAKKNHIIWADRYEGDTESIFSMQEDLLWQIVSSLEAQLNYDLLANIRKKAPVDLRAYENWLYGMQELKKGSVESDVKAREYFQRAIQLDPNYSLAYSGMSLTYFNEWSCQLWDRWEVSQKGASEWAKKAIALDEQNHVAALVLGRVYLYEGEYETSEHYLRRALRLNPNDIQCLVQIASCFTFLGYPEEAEKIYNKVLQLNPVGSDRYAHIGVLIAFELGEYEKAIEGGVKVKDWAWIDFPAYMAASYYYLNDFDSMQRFWNIYLEDFKNKILQGELTELEKAAQWILDTNPYRDKTNIKPFLAYITGKEITQVVRDDEWNQHAHTEENFFYKENDFWRISFEGKVIQMKEVKGFYDLTRLLGNPEMPVHCGELIGGSLIAEDEPLFDEKARRAYQKKIRDLQEEIHQAEENNDLARSAALQKEYDELLDHLSKSLGLNGKIRTTHDPIEKARSAVTWRIRKAIEKIDKANPALGKHLSVSVKTGMFCIYTPEKPLPWVFTGLN